MLKEEYVLTRKDGVVIHRHFSSLSNGYVHEIGTENYDVQFYCITPCNIEIEEVTFDQLPDDVKEIYKTMED